MIDEHFDDLAAATSTKRACALLGAHERRSIGVAARRGGPPAPRPAPPNKLTEADVSGC